MESHRRSNRSFPVQIATIVLVVFGLLEFLSLIGLNEGVIPNLPQSLSILIKSILFITILLGIYSLVSTSERGHYFVLLTSIFEVVFGADSLLRVSRSFPSNTPLLIQSLVVSVLGTIVCICMFMSEPVSQGGKNLSETDSSTKIKHHLSPTSAYAVEIEDVYKKYFLGTIMVSALNGLSVNVQRGEFLAIMGPSGSGKSTLLNLIGALDRPSSGSIFIDSIDISTLNDSSLAKLRNEKIGFVFQAYNLIARSSVLRNMELPALVKGYPMEERQKRIKSLLKIVGLSDKISRKPKTMSGGEQQRVSIARALMNDPSIVLADEPTGNIDSRTGKEIMGFLRKMNEEKGVTVIMVTHDREVARMADRIIYLRDGKITEEEKLRSFKK